MLLQRKDYVHDVVNANNLAIITATKWHHWKLQEINPITLELQKIVLKKSQVNKKFLSNMKLKVTLQNCSNSYGKKRIYKVQWYIKDKDKSYTPALENYSCLWHESITSFSPNEYIWPDKISYRNMYLTTYSQLSVQI